MCFLMNQLLYVIVYLDYIYNNLDKKLRSLNSPKLFYKHIISFPPDQVLIQEFEDFPVDSALMQALKRFSNQDYKITLDDVESLEIVSKLLTLEELANIGVMEMGKRVLRQVCS